MSTKSTNADEARSQHNDNLNTIRLNQALSDAARQSTGILAIEAWVLNDRRTHLLRPEGAWWRDVDYNPQADTSSDFFDVESAKQALAQLDEEENIENHDDHDCVLKKQIGEGLSGFLWSEETSFSHAAGISRFGSYHGNGPISLLSNLSHSLHARRKTLFRLKGKQTGIDELHNYKALIHWRSLEYISIDPDRIPDDRLNMFVQAGLGQVAGVPFDISGHKGIVIFYASMDTSKTDLEERRNDLFLRSAADHIGAVIAMNKVRFDSLENKIFVEEHSYKSPATVLENENAVIYSPKSSDSTVQAKVCCGPIRNFFSIKLGMLYEKAKGGKTSQPPPPSPLGECLWTFVGVFISILSVASLSYFVPSWRDGKEGFIFSLGPFGALSSLHFSLTAAPASQPRNILYGTAIAGSISLLFTYIPIDVIPIWVRLALATSTANSTLAYLGVVHPPAGAVAVIFASGALHWGHLLLNWLGCCVAIAISILINNLDEKRQYPQYWRFLPSSKED